MNRIKHLSLLLFLSLLISCGSIPTDAFRLSVTPMEDRKIQTRRFETTNRRLLLRASAGVLQDMGYSIDESNAKLGVLTASKRVDATEGTQIAVAVFVGLLTGTVMPIDTVQKLRLTLVINSSLDDESASLTRMTLQRVIWNSDNQVSKAETILSPEIYQHFFAKLSKSTFLEANEI